MEQTRIIFQRLTTCWMLKNAYPAVTIKDALMRRFAAVTLGRPPVSPNVQRSHRTLYSAGLQHMRCGAMLAVCRAANTIPTQLILPANQKGPVCLTFCHALFITAFN